MTLPPAVATIRCVVPAGWYPDPWQQAPSRWWDGASWTGHLAPGSSRLPALQRDEARVASWARWSVLVWGLLQAASAVASAVVGRGFRGWADTTNFFSGQPVPQAPGLAVWSQITSVLTLALVGAAIVFLVWQYRAASTARALGYPARWSPAFGIGSWFIPVANLWFPYWALRDCLPPSHPSRRWAPWVWVGYLAVSMLAVAPFVAGLFSTPAAVITAGIAIIITAVVVGCGWRLIDDITDDHRRAASRAWG